MTGVKVILSLFAFYIAYTQIDLQVFGEALSTTRLDYFVLAVVCYLASQLVSSRRLQLILASNESNVPFWWNSRLYLLGMAYNLFLPGGMGGDAYKVLVYSQRLKQPSKRFILPLIGDRIIGLAAILLLASSLTAYLPNNTLWWSTWPLWITSIIGVVLGYFIIIKWFSTYRSVYVPALSLSLVIQGIQMLGVLFLVWSIQGDQMNTVAILFIFLVSTIATAIPVFLGGLGAREVVFATLCPVFSMNAEQGTLIALLFSIAVIISSAPGLLLIFGKSEK